MISQKLQIVEENPTFTSNDALSKSFLSYFNMQDRMSPDVGEEEDNNVIVSILVEGSLGKSCEFHFENEPGNTRISLFYSDVGIESDEIQNIIRMGKRGESLRVISIDGSLIWYAPRAIIYRRDWSIRTQTESGRQIIDSDGHSFEKHNGIWMKDF